MRIPFALSLPAWLIQGWYLYPYGSMRHAVTIGSLYTWCLGAFWTGTLRSAMTHELCDIRFRHERV